MSGVPYNYNPNSKYKKTAMEMREARIIGRGISKDEILYGKETAKSHSIWLFFKKEITESECFQKIFLTIPIQRLNGCSFYKDKGNSEYNIVIISSFEYDILAEIYKVLNGAIKFTEILYEEKMLLGNYSYKGKKAAKISRGKVKTANEAVTKAISAIGGEEPIFSKNNFMAHYCKKCKNDVKGYSFCPDCKKQCRSVQTGAIIFMLAVFFIRLYQFIRMAFRKDHLTIPNWQSIIFDILAIAVLLAAIILLLKYRRIGMWLIPVFAVFNIAGVLYLHQSVSLSGYTMTNVIVTVILTFGFSAILFGLLIKDLPHME